MTAALALAGCSKEKEEEPAAPAPAGDQASGLKLELPEAEPTAAAPAEVASSAPEKQGVVRARFDGYAPRVANSLWQTVPLTEKVTQCALVTPTAPVPAGLAALKAGGPENIALATDGLLLETGTGRPLVVGREYDFAFSQEGTAWKVAISRAP